MKSVRSFMALSLVAASLMAGDIKTHTELSYIQTGGNTDTKSFGLDFHGEKALDQVNKLALDLQAGYAEDSGNETKNAWLAELNYYYKFSDVLSFNYLIGYKDDKFSGYKHQFYTGPGAEYIAINEKENKLKFYGNVLYENDKYDSGDTDNFTAGRLGLNWEYLIYQNLKFVEDANIRSKLSDMNNYFLYSKSSIYSKINSNLSLGVSYKLNYQNQAPATKKKTDTTFMVSLVIDW